MLNLFTHHFYFFGVRESSISASFQLNLKHLKKNRAMFGFLFGELSEVGLTAMFAKKLLSSKKGAILFDDPIDIS